MWNSQINILRIHQITFYVIAVCKRELENLYTIHLDNIIERVEYEDLSLWTYKQ